VLISPYPDQEENKLQRQEILIFIYPIYNDNWRNISTIYIYIYINIYVGQAKDLSATLYVGDRWTEGECEVGVSIQRVITSK